MTRVNLLAVAATALAAFILAALAGRWVIPALHRLHFGQTIREEGPAWHRKKQGTPTMGGVLFIGATVIAFVGVLIVAALVEDIPVFQETPLSQTRLFAGLLMALLCGAIGFADDYIKVVKKRNLGLSARQKLFCQLLVGLGYGGALYLAGDTRLAIPFVGMIDIGLWMVPLCILLVTGFTNAVNLTDGVDGLCGTVTFVVTLFFVVAAGLAGFTGQGLLAGALAGGLAGFLVWNLYPARVFMGDLGSLFLGGMVVAFAFGIGQPLLLFVVGIWYVLETLSVILQVLYFKLTHGKRLFKMSPLHHHLELCGWSENTIVLVCGAVTLLGGVGAWLLLSYA